MSQHLPKIELFTERAKLIANREQTVDVLVRVTPPEAGAPDGGRPKLNLSLVLDRSGSMEGVKIVRAREATAFCVDQMLPTDRLSITIFDDRIDLLVPSQLAENKGGIKEMVSSVQARGATALHEAWVRGGMEVSEHLMDQGINRVLLITDGLANTGVTSTDEIVSQAMGLFQRGVSTSTIGIGDDFNENLLMPMAQAAGGNAWHVEHADDMQRIFAVELEGLIAQVAHTVTLGLIPADGVRLADALNDFELTETGRYRLPNLQAGMPLEIVLQLHVPPQAEGTRLRLLDLRLGFTPQDAKAAEVVKQVHEVEFASESVVERLPVVHEVTAAVRLLMNARARREAIKFMDQGDFGSARAVVAQSLHATRQSCDALFQRADVAEECASLESLEASLVDRSQDKMNRKRLAYQAMGRSTGRTGPRNTDEE